MEFEGVQIFIFLNLGEGRYIQMMKVKHVTVIIINNNNHLCGSLSFILSLSLAWFISSFLHILCKYVSCFVSVSQHTHTFSFDSLQVSIYSSSWQFDGVPCIVHCLIREFLLAQKLLTKFRVLKRSRTQVPHFLAVRSAQQWSVLQSRRSCTSFRLLKLQNCATCKDDVPVVWRKHGTAFFWGHF
jgi:hypothetical protein